MQHSDDFIGKDALRRKKPARSIELFVTDEYVGGPPGYVGDALPIFHCDKRVGFTSSIAPHPDGAILLASILNGFSRRSLEVESENGRRFRIRIREI